MHFWVASYSLRVQLLSRAGLLGFLACAGFVMLVALGVRRNYTWSVLVVEADTRWVFAHRYTVILHMRLLRASGTPCGWCAWQVPLGMFK
jgi:hypothetical protein